MLLESNEGEDCGRVTAPDQNKAAHAEPEFGWPTLDIGTALSPPAGVLQATARGRSSTGAGAFDASTAATERRIDHDDSGDAADLFTGAVVQPLDMASGSTTDAVGIDTVDNRSERHAVAPGAGLTVEEEQFVSPENGVIVSYYLYGRDGGAMARISRFSGAVISHGRMVDTICIAGTQPQRELAKLCIGVVDANRGKVREATTSYFQTIASREDCSIVLVPQKVTAYVFGTQGSHLRQMEAKYRVFMFVRDEWIQGCKPLYILGGVATRNDAGIRIQALIDKSVSAGFVSTAEELASLASLDVPDGRNGRGSPRRVGGVVSNGGEVGGAGVGAGVNGSGSGSGNGSGSRPSSAAEDAYNYRTPSNAQKSKLFLGGLHPTTSKERLWNFFSEFGEIALDGILLMCDRDTNRPRGFGFVTFLDHAVAKQLVRQKYVRIDGRKVEIKFSKPMEELGEGSGVSLGPPEGASLHRSMMPQRGREHFPFHDLPIHPSERDGGHLGPNGCVASAATVHRNVHSHHAPTQPLSQEGRGRGHEHEQQSQRAADSARTPHRPHRKGALALSQPLRSKGLDQHQHPHHQHRLSTLYSPDERGRGRFWICPSSECSVWNQLLDEHCTACNRGKGAAVGSSGTLTQMQKDQQVADMFLDATAECKLTQSLNGKSSFANGDYGQADADGKVIVPETIACIANHAFAGCTEVTAIIIPGSVQAIGECAFAGCTALVSVTILVSNGSRASQLTIGEKAFSGCTRLKGIMIPGSVTLIGPFAFYRCTALSSIWIPGSVVTVGKSAFASCTGMTTASIPDSVEAIGDSAFAACPELSTVTIPDDMSMDHICRLGFEPGCRVIRRKFDQFRSSRIGKVYNSLPAPAAPFVPEGFLPEEVSHSLAGSPGGSPRPERARRSTVSRMLRMGEV